MSVVDMVFNSMFSGQVVIHYKKGNSNFFLKSLSDDVMLLDKVTRGCSCGVCCGSEDEINEYIKNNNLKAVGILEK